MSDGPTYPRHVLLPVAEHVVELLEPHCERVEIAGSLRREKPECADIEIVAVPKPYDVGLFTSGIATVVKYTQRIVPASAGPLDLRTVKLDLFFAEPDNWGSIFLIRTGSWEFSKWFMGTALPRAGYRQADGYVWRGPNKVPVREERDLFSLAGVPWVEPRERTGAR